MSDILGFSSKKNKVRYYHDNDWAKRDAEFERRLTSFREEISRYTDVENISDITEGESSLDVESRTVNESNEPNESNESKEPILSENESDIETKTTETDDGIDLFNFGDEEEESTILDEESSSKSKADKEPELPKEDEPTTHAPKSSVKKSKVKKSDTDFDHEGFEEVRNVVTKILSGTFPVKDTSSLSSQIQNREYAVDLRIDPRGEDVDHLSNVMMEVQSKLDGANSVLQRLLPRAAALEKAWDYVKHVGILFAKGSNREKRDAQVRYEMKDLWIEYSEISRLSESFQKEMWALKGQWETVSRLMTFELNKTQLCPDLNRGGSTPAPKRTRARARVDRTTSLEEEKEDAFDPDEGHEETSLDDSSVEGLEDFPSTSKAKSKARGSSGGSAKGKGFTGWDF